jgi:hypothetical protein
MTREKRVCAASAQGAPSEPPWRTGRVGPSAKGCALGLAASLFGIALGACGGAPQLSPQSGTSQFSWQSGTPLPASLADGVPIEAVGVPPASELFADCVPERGSPDRRRIACPPDYLFVYGQGNGGPEGNVEAAMDDAAQGMELRVESKHDLVVDGKRYRAWLFSQKGKGVLAGLGEAGFVVVFACQSRQADRGVCLARLAALMRDGAPTLKAAAKD